MRFFKLLLLSLSLGFIQPSYGQQALFHSQNRAYFTYDTDAQAFITAASITDNTQKLAVNSLVLSLKSYGIWAKSYCLYPMVGGTSTAHKFNLKNPSDTDAAFRLSFVGGWTHSATGALPNGTTGYANTFFNQITQGTDRNNIAFTYYSRSNTNAGVDMGVEASGSCRFAIRLSGLTFAELNESSGGGISSLISDSRGCFTDTKSSSSSKGIYKNGVLLTSTFGGSTTATAINGNIYLGAQNGASNFFSSRECAFAAITQGLTGTEAANFYTAIQAFETALSRQL